MKCDAGQPCTRCRKGKPSSEPLHHIPACHLKIPLPPGGYECIYEAPTRMARPVKTGGHTACVVFALHLPLFSRSQSYSLLLTSTKIGNDGGQTMTTTVHQGPRSHPAQSKCFFLRISCMELACRMKMVGFIHILRTIFGVIPWIAP